MIWIPLADDETLSEEVIKSLPEAYTVNTEPRYSELTHAQSVAINRNKIFKRFLHTNESYLKMQDSCVVHNNPDNYLDMVRFLDERPDWGGVALHSGKIIRGGNLEKNHVRFRCVVIRREALKGIVLEVPGAGCECYVFSKEIRKRWRYGYLEVMGGRISTIK